MSDSSEREREKERWGMKNEKNKAEKEYNILRFCYSNYLEVVNFTVYFACMEHI